ncbi:MAG: site-specific integrase [Synergistaceae bacterium]|nr:site-specific integrase [Candidatus Equadaptatus faecalis]
MIYRTEKDIENIKQTDKPQRIRIAPNLYLNVTQKTSKLAKKWYIRTKFNGKTVYEFIGFFDPKSKNHKDSKHISLNHALDITAEKIVSKSRAARMEKISDKEFNPYFSVMCEKWFDIYHNNQRESTAINALKIIRKYIETASFYNKRLRNIQRKEIRDLVVDVPIATANKMLGYIRKVFLFAKNNGYYAPPAYTKADAEVPTPQEINIPTKSEKHFNAIIDPYDFAIMIKKIREHSEFEYITTRAILFLAYNFCRGGEMLKLQWKDIDLDFDNLIKLPKEKVKHNEELLIPFSKQTRQLLIDIRKYRIKNDNILGKNLSEHYVFHKHGDIHSPMSSSGLSKFMRKLGYGIETHCLHGFRSSASTMLREQLDFQSELIESQLGHHIGTGVERIYNRATLLEKRKEMLQTYSDYIDYIVGLLDKPRADRSKFVIGKGDSSNRKVKIIDIATGHEEIITLKYGENIKALKERLSK